MTPKPRMYAKLVMSKRTSYSAPSQHVGNPSLHATPRRLLGVHTERAQRKDNLTSYSQVIPV